VPPYYLQLNFLPLPYQFNYTFFTLYILTKAPLCLIIKTFDLFRFIIYERGIFMKKGLVALTLLLVFIMTVAVFIPAFASPSPVVVDFP